MNAPYRRYASLDRMPEARLDPPDSGFDCNGCPGDGCCGDCITRSGCSCGSDVDGEDLIIEEALQDHREDRAA